MNGKAIWTALPLLIILLAAGVLWRGGNDTAADAITLTCADLTAGCATRLHGREVAVGLDGAVRPLTPFRVWVKATGAREVLARFTMEGMDMGFNLYTLRVDGEGIFRGQVTLPMCVTGRRDWIMVLEIDGGVLKVPFASEG